jgi:hypothetical protein
MAVAYEGLNICLTKQRRIINRVFLQLPTLECLPLIWLQVILRKVLINTY